MIFSENIVFHLLCRTAEGIFYSGIVSILLYSWTTTSVFSSLSTFVMNADLELYWNQNSFYLTRIWTACAAIVILRSILRKAPVVKDGSVLATESSLVEVGMTVPSGKALARAFQFRKAGQLPPSYPTGWYHVCFSHELKSGEVKYIQNFGEHLALFRTESGKAAVLDAYCPHLGANLAVGGKVVGENLQCPFHGWEFGGDGQCENIPYCDQIPSNAKVASWPTCEINGAVYLYFDELGRTPAWEIPRVPLLDEGRFVYHSGTENHIEAHIQEIPENGSDTAHLDFLHVPFKFGVVSSNLFAHKWSCSTWTPCEAPNEHLAKFTVDESLLFMGKVFPLSRVHVKVTQTGPSFVVLEVGHPLGNFIIVQTVTPISPLFQKVTNSIWGKNNWFTRLLGILFLYLFAQMFERDMMIWRNKTYRAKPLLVKNDGQISAFRRWYKQFYPPNVTPAEKTSSTSPSSSEETHRRWTPSSHSW
eukprot:TRINITY_DN5380_c0_g1_i1.p1 TRINITY_DN5380_c0_g1~~TRINITY_DN5380_c0_g1_i1.p1  ORF type:complete len:475 (-),score=69.94 TRINITY_DN5380_c0_g1_i1:44-1468(-)